MYEVVFAIGIAAIIITGVLVVSTTSVRNSTYSRNNAQATKYAQEAMEWLRSERDAGGSVFSRHSGACNIGSLGWGACGNCVITGTIFCRRVTLTVGVDTIDAVVEVSWDDSQGNHTVKSVTKFTNWNK